MSSKRLEDKKWFTWKNRKWNEQNNTKNIIIIYRNVDELWTFMITLMILILIIMFHISWICWMLDDFLKKNSINCALCFLLYSFRLVQMVKMLTLKDEIEWYFKIYILIFFFTFNLLFSETKKIITFMKQLDVSEVFRLIRSLKMRDLHFFKFVKFCKFLSLIFTQNSKFKIRKLSCVILFKFFFRYR